MGAYDCVCMLTGVSLRPTDAVAVLLRQRGEQSYSPIALPVFGGYDSMGGVDAIDEDANAGLLVDSLQRNCKRDASSPSTTSTTTSRGPNPAPITFR